MEHYLRLIQARGVLIRPIGSSPHAIPPRTWGYYITPILPGRKKPFTVRYAEFSTKDDDWLDRHSLFSAPDPVMVDGRSLTVRVGWEKQAWTEQVLVPIQDVEQVTEFPFRHYPGAVLKSLGPLSDYDLLSRQDVVRFYVVDGASIREIGAHYQAELHKLGIENARATADGLFWRGTSKAGLDAVVVAVRSIGVIPGSGLGLADLKQLVPHVFEGFPASVRQLLVSVSFANADTRLRYLGRADQERHKALVQVGHQPTVSPAG